MNRAEILLYVTKENGDCEQELHIDMPCLADTKDLHDKIQELVENYQAEMFKGVRKSA